MATKWLQNLPCSSSRNRCFKKLEHPKNGYTFVRYPPGEPVLMGSPGGYIQRRRGALRIGFVRKGHRRRERNPQALAGPLGTGSLCGVATDPDAAGLESFAKKTLNVVPFPSSLRTSRR